MAEIYNATKMKSLMHKCCAIRLVMELDNTMDKKRFEVCATRLVTQLEMQNSEHLM